MWEKYFHFYLMFWYSPILSALWALPFMEVLWGSPNAKSAALWTLLVIYRWFIHQYTCPNTKISGVPKTFEIWQNFFSTVWHLDRTLLKRLINETHFPGYCKTELISYYSVLCVCLLWGPLEQKSQSTLLSMKTTMIKAKSKMIVQWFSPLRKGKPKTQKQENNTEAPC